jgi:hypothetical protein
MGLATTKNINEVPRIIRLAFMIQIRSSSMTLFPRRRSGPNFSNPYDFAAVVFNDGLYVGA